jgi:RHS repeat-associated protein
MGFALAVTETHIDWSFWREITTPYHIHSRLVHSTGAAALGKNAFTVDMIYTPSMRKARTLPLILLLSTAVSGQVFGQSEPYRIVSQPDPRLGADLTTASFGNVTAPQLASAPLSPLPIQIEPDYFTGGLALRIRLAIPLAKGRSVPDLTLAYHSQQSYGSVGVGWTFSAGSIVRSRAHGIDYSSKDFLITLGHASVDLVNVKDDLYRDKQGDLRVEAQYNPADDSWMVFDSFGTKYSFGSADDSRLSGASGTIQWSLDRVEDLTGNYSYLTYSKTAGVLNLTSLLFSGNSRLGLEPLNRVDIKYEAQPREATTTSFASGIRATNSTRIRQIDITTNAHPYATYNFKYRSSQETGRSLLVAVTRDSSPLSSSINFSYSDTIQSKSTYLDNIKSNSWSRALVTGPTKTDTIYTQCLMGDFDGDGKGDLACALDTSGQWQMGISKGSSDSGDETQIKQHYDGFNVSVWPGPAVKKQIQIDIPFSSPLFSGKPNKKQTIADVRSTCLVGDFNGDSRTDIACYNSTDGSWNVGLSNGHGFDAVIWRNGPVLAGGAGGDAPLTDRCVVGDFDGDGKTDIACLVSSTAVSDEGKWSVALSTGKGWQTSLWTGSSPTGASEKVSGACVAADFNGDRMQDIACYGATDHVWHVAISTGKMFHSSAWADGPAITGDFGPQAVVPSHCVVGDFNGDGNADIACYTGTSGAEEFNGNWSMGFSTGSGWSTVEWLGPPVPTSKADGWIVANQCVTGDFNGDGRTDIACNYITNPHYSVPFRIANGDCNADKDRIEQFDPKCVLVPVWAQSLSTGSGFTSALFSPNKSVFLTSTAWGLPWAGCVAGDFTGDGKSDLLCDRDKPDQFILDISDFRPTDVITDVRDSLGLTGHFSYEFSSFEKDTELGFSIPLLKRRVFSDGLTTTAASYAYSGGAYFKAGNRFRGFHQVQIVKDADPAGRQLLETLWFHQGDGLAPDEGSAQDGNGVTAGKLYRRTLEDRQKRPLFNTLLEYGLEPTTVPNDKAPRMVRQTTEISSSTGSVRKTTALSYDQAGNISDTVVASGNGPNSLETHEHSTYSNDSEAHAFGYPLSYELSDNQFGKLRQAIYSYDTSACDKPAQGTHLWQLTGVKRWINADISAEEKFSHSASGNVTCSEDGVGNKTVSIFDAQDEHLTKIINPLNQTVAFSYYGIDSEALGANAGRVSSTTNASGDVTQFSYDAFGRLEHVSNPDSSSTKISYDDFGDPTRQSVLSESSEGLTTKQLVDGYGRRYLFGQSAPQGKAVGFAISYDQNGKLIRIDSPAVMPSLGDRPSGATVQLEIQRDELERVLLLRDARGAVSKSCYDGLRAARLDANGNAWVDTFDVFGNRVSTEEYSQRLNDCTRVLQFHPPLSDSGLLNEALVQLRLLQSAIQVKPDQFDHAAARGLVNELTITLYKYDGLNRLREVTRQGKSLTSINYDGLGNVSSIKNVDHGESRYSYDQTGQLKRWMPESSRTIEFNRDVLGRVIEVFNVGRNGKRNRLETFSYDRGDHAAGRLTQGIAGRVRTDLFYDPMGRVSRRVDAIGGHNFDLEMNYDGLGRIDAIKYPDGTDVRYEYDGSMLSAIEWEDHKLVQLQDFNGYLEPTSQLFGNGVRETRVYGNTGPQLTSCQSVPASYLCSISAIGAGGDQEFKLLYQYDPTANVSRIEDLGVGETSFSYDSFDRITAEAPVASSGIPNVNYSYDQIGRRVSVSGEGAYQYPENAATAFSAPSQVGPTGISYDEGGRRKTYGKERYEFDAFGRLVEVRMPSPHKTSIRYSYDAFGNVISRKAQGKKTGYYVSLFAECANVGSHSALECRDLVYSPDGPVAALGSGRDGLRSAREPEYYLLDRDGTIRSVTDQNGATVAKFSYSVFGIPSLVGSTQSRPLRNYRWGDQRFYAGHRWDADSGLYYFGTRFYDPRIGQFLSPDADTIIASGEINTYTYARNNPNRWIDPDGRQEGTMTTGGGGSFLGGSLGSNGISISLGGGPNLGGFSGPGPSFSSSPGVSINFGAPGVHGGNLSFAGASLQAFSGSNATLAPLAQNQAPSPGAPSNGNGNLYFNATAAYGGAVSLSYCCGQIYVGAGVGYGASATWNYIPQGIDPASFLRGFSATAGIGWLSATWSPMAGGFPGALAPGAGGGTVRFGGAVTYSVNPVDVLVNITPQEIQNAPVFTGIPDWLDGPIY